MITIACVFIYLAIKKHYEPLLLIPIGFGILLANIPMPPGFELISPAFMAGTAGPSNVMDYIYMGIIKGFYPPLIFLGVGALTDFSSLLANPRLVLLGAAAQFGIFVSLAGALWLGFSPGEAASIGIIGGADGPTSIFLTSRLAPHLIAPVAIAGYSYIALVPVLQPPVMYLLTTKAERRIKMPPARSASKLERILFPIASFLICSLIAPGAVLLLGMLFLGNLLKESGVTDRLSNTAKSSFIDTVTILVGVSVGASASAETFLKTSSLKIFGLGAFSFIIATGAGVLCAKLMNLFTKNKINPLIGAAGVSAVPDSARVAQMVGAKEDPTNFLLMHAMGPNVAGVIGSAIAAGILWALIGG
ncbi:MAG: sodium ion-translocating decarboxylase subunit beta [Dehalococcoidia bacterium]|nr:sodium ion-translocating decarboxylase subunit beta [Dehalococcoidia bacterium]MBE0610733.1 sodium ion-translocating decarboxylase subunit beta [Dehalococcoidia bacterium]